MEGNNRVKIKKIRKNQQCQVWFHEENLKMSETVPGFIKKQNKRQINNIRNEKGDITGECLLEALGGSNSVLTQNIGWRIKELWGCDLGPVSWFQWLIGKIMIDCVADVQLLGRVRLCDPVDCSTPGFPVLHHLPELAQTHACWASKEIVKINEIE